MLVRGSCPLKIEMATGSYDVPGPSVELVAQVDADRAWSTPGAKLPATIEWE